MVRVLALLLVTFSALPAQEDSIVRRRLDLPETVSGVRCDRTGRAYAEFFQSGALRSCPLASDTTIQGHAFVAGSWITIDQRGRLTHAWLSRDTQLGGHLCHGTGYKGFSVEFRDDGTLRLCYLARDTIIHGVPCIHGSFWTEILGGSRTAVTFWPDGSLAACQLSRDARISGVTYRKRTRVIRHEDGTLEASNRNHPPY
jgi:hypothetical protein